MLEQMATAQGEGVVTGMLGARAVELTQLLEATFPARPLSEIEAAYKPSGVAVNEAVAQLARAVREQAAIAIDHFKQAELWLVLKSPAVSDGNNFGVDVQQYVASELKEMRKGFTTMIAAPSDYHWARAAGLEKVAKDSTQDADESTTTETSQETKEGKTEEKTSVKTVKKSGARIDHGQALTHVGAGWAGWTLASERNLGTPGFHMLRSCFAAG